jgi:hypothetical protein
VTETVIDANHVTGARGHVTAAVVDGRAGQVQADDGSLIPSTLQGIPRHLQQEEGRDVTTAQIDRSRY